ncbi:MAG TPA: response regulator [Bacteroidia bacterium]|nr:response regulator [Bacteroidia bacterium]HNP98324.1 response regulator [Bacteroidia bacterium]
MIKMLVVDDEQDVEMLFSQRFRKELKNQEVKIHFAFSGEDALQFLRTLDPFDLVLVLSDINMPGMTGLELLRIIRTEFPTLRVMMVTAYGDQNNYDNAVAIGANDFVTKPVDFALLKEKIYKLAP